MTSVAVLEVGGTHARASWVDTAQWTVGSAARCDVRADASAHQILDALAACLTALGSLDGAVLSVAMPGPFDYAQGIGRFHGVGKFDALNGVHVGAGLRARLTPPPARIAFVNDAAAFGLGEWLVGAARDATRALAITLGTGIGSAFVDDGRVVESGDRVPPDGHVYRLVVDGQPLEQLVSRRAMLARYRAAGGGDEDVAAIAARARAGEATARAAFVDPLKLLGRCLAPWLLRFDAPVLVVGGAMSASWELVEQALRAGLAAAGAAAVDVRRASDPDSSTAAGAAWHAVRIDSARREVRGESPDEKR